MDENDDDSPLGGVEAEIRELLGLFDVPSFARRGQDVESALARIDARCGLARVEMLGMVHVRLRQWAAVASGPSTALAVFARPIDDLWPLAGAEAPAWAGRDAPARRLRSVARDLVASVRRFDDRWARFVDGLDLAAVNRVIDGYNRYYLIEKECSLGSPRLAARFFRPKPEVSRADLLARHPLIPVPAWKS